MRSRAVLGREASGSWLSHSMNQLDLFGPRRLDDGTAALFNPAAHPDSAAFQLHRANPGSRKLLLPAAQMTTRMSRAQRRSKFIYFICLHTRVPTRACPRPVQFGRVRFPARIFCHQRGENGIGPKPAAGGPCLLLGGQQGLGAGAAAYPGGQPRLAGLEQGGLQGQASAANEGEPGEPAVAVVIGSDRLQLQRLSCRQLLRLYLATGRSLDRRKSQLAAIGQQRCATVAHLCHRRCADRRVFARRFRRRQRGCKRNQISKPGANRHHGRLWERPDAVVNMDTLLNGARHGAIASVSPAERPAWIHKSSLSGLDRSA